jgi:AraC-like DNA-binding protein
MGSNKRYGTPRRFLAWFMLVPLFLFTSHFLFFAPYPDIFPYFEFPLAFAGLLVFPLYHIYFRLLTVDEKFSLKSHIWFLIIPVVIGLIYGIAILITPMNEFKAWLFDETVLPASLSVHFLQVMRKVIRLTVLIQLIVTVVSNSLLINKYRDKAEQFYSNLNDTKHWNSIILNYSILVMSLASFAALALGRPILMQNDVLVLVIWSVFSISLYLIGLLGMRQNPINPAYDAVTSSGKPQRWVETSLTPMEHLTDRIIAELEVNKVYLNSELSIVDFAKTIGSNRTYISAVINQNFNQNFCAFVNTFRFRELEKNIVENPEYSIEKMAETCGFGSVNSMKRAVTIKTGLAFNDYRSQIFGEKQTSA